MPKDKSESHERVNAAIKTEFTEKGYADASVRSIGKRAGMTSAGLYRHYKDKAAMFDALVEPVLNSIAEWTENHKKSKYSLVDDNADKNTLFGETFVDMIKTVILPRKEEFRLLLCYSKGTKYENFIHDFVDKNQGELSDAIEYMRSHGYPAAELGKEELHMLLSAYITAIFEPIIHDYPEENIERYLDRINDFFMPGWMKIMGL